MEERRSISIAHGFLALLAEAENRVSLCAHGGGDFCNMDTSALVSGWEHSFISHLLEERHQLVSYFWSLLTWPIFRLVT